MGLIAIDTVYGFSLEDFRISGEGVVQGKPGGGREGRREGGREGGREE